MDFFSSRLKHPSFFRDCHRNWMRIEMKRSFKFSKCYHCYEISVYVYFVRFSSLPDLSVIRIVLY